MKTRLLRWVPIALFLFVALIGFLRKPITPASQFPCRPIPEICHPETQPPLCESICPDTDNTNTHRKRKGE